MITITPQAAERLRLMMESKGQAGYAVRLKIAGRAVSEFQYDFRSVPLTMQEPHEQVCETNGMTVLLSEQDIDNLRDSEIDLKPDGGFKISNPNPVWSDETGPEVARLIEEKINPGIAMHGGYIHLVDLREGIAYIRMGGGCQGCSLRNVTLKDGIDKMIREVAPQVTEIIDVTKHDQGVNPYYTGPGGPAHSPMGQNG